ncbi:MAG: glycine oxidase ThiO [Gammaproteobacteria bacterium]|nr:glycine oxidase ThiO [Gammaproteobacteria bacterium]
MPSNSSVVVIGGGVVGLSTAHALATAGCAVTVFERRSGAQEASWAGGGILAPLMPWECPAALSSVLAYSQRIYPALCATLHAHTGVDPEWTRSGALILGGHEDPAGVGQWLQPQELAATEPSVRAGRALLLDDVAQVRNPRLLAAFYARLPQLGVRLRLEEDATGLDVRGGRVAGVRAGAERLAADAVVVAAGAWSPALLDPTGLKLPVRPVKGQMLLLRGRPGLFRRIVLGCEAYLVPRRDGRILVGSTVEDAGFDKRPTESARIALRAAAEALVPATAGLPLEAHWAGLRPGSPDGLPYIGRHPELPNLFVNTGHFRLGLTLAPASAELLADLVLERPPRFDPTPFRVDRHEVAV